MSGNYFKTLNKERGPGLQLCKVRSIKKMQREKQTCTDSCTKGNLLAFADCLGH